MLSILCFVAKNIKMGFKPLCSETHSDKNFQKLYKNHSGTPGGMKIKTFSLLKNTIPSYIIEKAIRGMLPKTTLGRKIFRKLYVYATSNHPHDGQMPEKIN